MRFAKALWMEPMENAKLPILYISDLKVAVTIRSKKRNGHMTVHRFNTFGDKSSSPQEPFTHFQVLTLRILNNG
jgi:hypothetical protein